MKRTNAVANAVISFAPFVLLAFLIVVMTPLFAIVAASILYFTGIVSLINSKRGLFRDGVLTSFGPSQMDAKHRRKYFSAYGAIGAGVLINVTSLLIHT